MANRQRDPDKERFWRDALARWRRSGQTIRAFCRAEHIAEPSFYAWRRILAEREPSAARLRRPRRADRTQATPKLSFLPVHVVGDGLPAGAVIELQLGSGHVVRVRPGFDRATLAQVLAVLHEQPC
jgi:hypothetical protein